MDITQSSSRIINSFPPLNNITPFTRVDGWSFLEVLEGLRNYIVNILIPEIEGNNKKVTDQLNAWFEQYQIDHAELIAQINNAKAGWQDAFDEFMADVVAQLEALNDQAVANLVNNELSLVKTALNGKFVKRNETYVNVSDFGAKPDGTDSSAAIMSALEFADGKPVMLMSGETYTITKPLTMPSNGKFVLTSGDGEPAKIYYPGQSMPLINIVDSEPVATKVTTADVNMANRSWTVADTIGVEVGMIMEVMSSKSWYHDPRPESSDARKSEIHKVVRVDAGTVWVEDASNDSYFIANETVTLRFFKPYSVNLYNIEFEAVLPPPGETTSAIQGVVINRAMHPIVERVKITGCAYTGVVVKSCYSPIVRDSEIRDANHFFTGYGVSVSQCANARVDNVETWNCRRGVDVTGGQIISRNTDISNCTIHGGGWNSRGEIYSFPETISNVGADQYGMGTHGAAANTRYYRNRILNVRRPFSLRGNTEIVDSNLVIGRTWGGVIQVNDGMHLVAVNNVATGTYWGAKDYSYSGTTTSGGRLMRPDHFIVISPTADYNPDGNARRGRVTVRNNFAEVQEFFIRTGLNILPRGQFAVSGNTVMFAGDDAHTPWLIDNFSSNPIEDTIPSTWKIGPNDLHVDQGPQVAGVVKNSKMGGSYVNHVKYEPMPTTQAGIGASLSAPFVNGASTTLNVVFDKPFTEIPKVVTSSNNSTCIATVSAVSLTGFTSTIKAIADSQYGAGSTYIAFGKVL